MAQFGDLQLDKARRKTAETAALKKLVVPMAQTLITNNSESIKSLLQIGEQCRQIGALNEAAQLFYRAAKLDSTNTGAARMRDLLAGNNDTQHKLAAGPVPFVRVGNFLSKTLHKKLITQSIADLHQFEDSRVYGSTQDEAAPNPNLRRGKNLTSQRVAAYSQLFLPELRAFVQNESIMQRLGMGEPSNLRFEVQVTNYADGDFFARHVDDGTPNLRHRKVSYVYYMRREGSRFSGGDLILYDQAPKANPNTLPSYTRIHPFDNSIVFFRSSCIHEVLPTFIDSGKRADGRFSINGWLVT